jgi:hypothetical protein
MGEWAPKSKTKQFSTMIFSDKDNKLIDKATTE